MKSFLQFLEESRKSLEATYKDEAKDFRPFFDKIVKQLPKFTPAERYVLDNYNRSGLGLNKALRLAYKKFDKKKGRNPDPEEILDLISSYNDQDEIAAIDDLIQQKGIVIPQQMNLYRGVLKPKQYANVEYDPEFKVTDMLGGYQPQFLSTSVSPRAAASIHTSEQDTPAYWKGRTPALMQLRIPSNTKFLPKPDPQGGLGQGEHEFIFPRGTVLDTEEKPSSKIKFYAPPKSPSAALGSFLYSLPMYRSYMK